MCHINGKESRKLMIYVISYDIDSDRIRAKLAKLLEGCGMRVQYSVFECRLTDKRFQKLYQDIFKLTDGKCEGSVRFYMLCKNCEEKILTIGKPLNELAVLQQDVIIMSSLGNSMMNQSEGVGFQKWD